MIILGIHDGHNSGASLLVDGELAASVSEERLTRSKNEIGYPQRSIEEVLRISGCSRTDISQVVFASNYMHSEQHLRQAEQWYRADARDQAVETRQSPEVLKHNLETRKRERVESVTEQLGCASSQISFVDHHLAHAAAAYYGSPFSRDTPTLILTCDGSGDGLSSTVSVGKGPHIERIASTARDASLGKIYSRVTYALGLTPWEHEYKVMGLAPYAHQVRAEELAKVFFDLVDLDDDALVFRAKSGIHSSYIYEYLKEKLERRRFDEISAAVQFFTEEMLCAWVRNCIRKTGIRRIVCGGGVFMNVKANMRISQMPEVDEMFVFPSCGDESLSFGAVWLAHHAGATGGQVPTPQAFLKHVYLGAEASKADVVSAIDKYIANQGCTVRFSENIEGEIAQRLVENKVVARCSGRMEWGARALGNRSILANPRNWSNVEKINAMIKMRDFWMPFAPSMLAEDTGRYLKNPKSISSPYMMFAYDTLPLAQTELGAAIHPRDKTARAQFVYKDQNPQYHQLISKFKELTGQSAILNTSFNLHGYPLVNSPYDAIDVFLRSGLDCLALGDALITKGE